MLLKHGSVKPLASQLFSSLLFLTPVSDVWYVVYVNMICGKWYMSRHIHFSVIVFSAVARLDL